MILGGPEEALEPHRSADWGTSHGFSMSLLVPNGYGSGFPVDLAFGISPGELVANPRFTDNTRRARDCALLKQEFEATLKTRPVAHWQTTVHAAGVPIGPLLTVTQAAEHPQTQARNM